MHISILERDFCLRSDVEIRASTDLSADGEVERGAEGEDTRNGDGGYGQ